MAGRDGPNAEKRPAQRPGDNANCDVFTPTGVTGSLRAVLKPGALGWTMLMLKLALTRRRDLDCKRTGIKLESRLSGFT